MDESIKAYANTLYEASLMESARTQNNAQADALRKISRKDSNVPISGGDILVVVRVFDEHIERCVEARLSSYQGAYSEATSVPNEADFNNILAEIRAVHAQQMAHATVAIRD